jgi:DNA-binding response OmpR family regulator
LLVAAGVLSPAAFGGQPAGPRGGLDAVADDDELRTLAMQHEDALCALLAERHGLPAIALTTSTIDLRALDRVSEAIVRDDQLLPVLLEENLLTVATARPELERSTAELEAASGCRVVVVVAVAALLRPSIEFALAARARGERVLVGAFGKSPSPRVHLTRPSRASLLPAPDAVAKELGAILAFALEDTPSPLPPSSPPPPSPRSPSMKLGAVRLKQVARPGGHEVGRMPAADVVSAATMAEATRPLLAPPPLVEGQGPRVLVVEDDDAIRHLLVRVLSGDGCVVEAAADGRTALAMLQRRPPDLAVLDAMLPEVHGFELCRAIKGNAAWASSVAVLMVSAVFRGFDNARQIQETHGADAFIEKPFELAHLRHVVADLLRRPRPALPQAPAVVEQRARARALLEHFSAAGDVERAAETVAAWLAIDPFDATAWLGKGSLAARSGDAMGALYAFERAATYDRTLFPAQVALATTYASLGFVRRARATWARAMACAPDAETAARLRVALTGT